MEALHLVFIFLFIGVVLYGFYKLRGTVQIFVLVGGLVVCFFVCLYMYFDRY